MKILENKILHTTFLSPLASTVEGKKLPSTDTLSEKKVKDKSCCLLSQIFIRIKDWIDRHLYSCLLASNGSIEDANVFCFADKHFDKTLAKHIASCIKQNYRTGDVILVEGVKAGENPIKQNLSLSIPLDPSMNIVGWEVENYRELIGTSKDFNTMKKRLKDFTESRFYSHIPEGNKISGREIGDLERDLESSIWEYKELREYFDPQGIQGEGLLRESFKMLKEGKIGPIEFKYLVLKLLSKLEKKIEKTRHQKMDAACIEQLNKGLLTRNAQLVQEIKRYRAQGRRVFVIAGASHFLNMRTNERSTATKQIQQLLCQEKFVLFGKWSMLLTHILEPLRATKK